MTVNALLVVVTLVAAAAPLDEGKAQWRVMNLERAAAHFEAAVRRAKDEDARAQALVWLGLARAELGEFPRAKAHFVAALRLRRDVTLPVDAGEIAPRVRGLFEAAALDVDGPRPLPRDLPDERLPPVHGEPAEVGDASPTSSFAGAPPMVTTTTSAPADEGAPFLVVGAIALAGSGVMLLATAAAVDVAAGPELLDGGTPSVVFLGAGAVLLLAGGGLGAAAALTR